MKPLLSYIVVRRDLSHAQQVVQASHAAMEMGWGWGTHEIDMETVHIAALSVANQDELMEVVKGLEMDSWEYVLFNEPDNNTGYTALCTYPSTRRNNRLGKLPLID